MPQAGANRNNPQPQWFNFQKVRAPNRDSAFQYIEDQHQYCRQFTTQAQHSGGAGIT